MGSSTKPSTFLRLTGGILLMRAGMKGWGQSSYFSISFQPEMVWSVQNLPVTAGLIRQRQVKPHSSAVPENRGDSSISEA